GCGGRSSASAALNQNRWWVGITAAAIGDGYSRHGAARQLRGRRRLMASALRWRPQRKCSEPFHVIIRKGSVARVRNPISKRSRSASQPVPGGGLFIGRELPEIPNLHHQSDIHAARKWH